MSNLVLLQSARKRYRPDTISLIWETMIESDKGERHITLRVYEHTHGSARAHRISPSL